MANWKVSLLVSGPITIDREIKFRAEKGSENPFWTDICVKNRSHGVQIDLVARAENQTDANDAALYFVGQALDYLCLKVKLPIFLSLTGTHVRQVADNVRRIVGLNEWIECFVEGRNIGSNRPTYSRALSWFRKAKNCEDPVDAYLSCWSAIEGVGSKFSRDTERTRRGAINKICDCFDQVWGDSSRWKVIQNNAQALNDFQTKRNGIAHGFMSIDIDTVRSISSELESISELAYEFLLAWGELGLNPEPQQNA